MILDYSGCESYGCVPSLYWSFASVINFIQADMIQLICKRAVRMQKVIKEQKNIIYTQKTHKSKLSNFLMIWWVEAVFRI